MKNSAHITNTSIDAVGLPKDPKYAIAEYIWNGFDAKASKIAISYESNELGYIDSISIEDNGEGIDHRSLNMSFGNFLDSMKKVSLRRTSYVRGRKGKGRFSFSLFAARATWKTRYREGDVIQEYDIIIDGDQKHIYEDSFKIASLKTDTGTTVLLEGIFGLNAGFLESAAFFDFLALEFGWFLFLNRDQQYEITINGKRLRYEHLILENETVHWDIAGTSDSAYNFKVTFVRWREAIGDRYYYYFLNTEKIEVAKELTSFNNNAINFHHSVYVESAFFNVFEQASLAGGQENNLFSEHQHHVIFRKLSAELRNLLERKQKRYVREHVAESTVLHIQNRNILPHYGEEEEEQLRKKQVISLLRELCIAEPRVFVSMKLDYLKAYLGFIDLLLQTNKRGEILAVIDQTLPLGDTEKENIRNILS